MKKKKILISSIAVFILIVLISHVHTFGTHTVYPRLMDEYKLEQTTDLYEIGGYSYFFVQSDEHYCFNGNGLLPLKYYAPECDASKLDTDKYNYIVAINCEISSISYSYKTAYRTMTFGIDTYIADADLTKTYDNTVRIYKMKKVNIDYDYQKYGIIGANFEDADKYYGG